MAESLKEKGFERSWEQCRQRVKKLRQDYKQVADYQKGTGNKRKQHDFKYFDQLNAFLAHRPAIRPPHIVSSSSSETNASGETENSDDDDVHYAQTSHDQSTDGDVITSFTFKFI